MKELVRVISKRRDEPVLMQVRCGMQRSGYKTSKALKRSDSVSRLIGSFLENDFHSFAGQLRLGESPLA